MLAFIVGLKTEAKLLSPLRARTFIGGGTAAGAAEAATRAVNAGARALISFGLAGGLNPELQPGAILVPARLILHGRQIDTDASLSAALGGVTCAALLASDGIVGSVAGKAERWRDMHAEAVDLESGAVATAARRADLPFAVLRAICDPATRSLPPAAMAALSKSGGISLGGLLGSLLLNPGQLTDLRELAKDAAAARAALASHVASLRDRADLRFWMTQSASGI